MEIWITFAVLAVLMGIVGARAARHDYTAGSGMFKKGDENLKKDEHMDSSDFDYFYDKGHMK